MHFDLGKGNIGGMTWHHWFSNQVHHPQTIGVAEYAILFYKKIEEVKTHLF
jgi:hypothetical protein